MASFWFLAVMKLSPLWGGVFFATKSYSMSPAEFVKRENIDRQGFHCVRYASLVLPAYKKRPAHRDRSPLIYRGDRIRTCDLLTPSQAR